MLRPMPAPDSTASILVVGDIHNHWRLEDNAFLERNRHDLVLFVGDLGDEDVEFVRQVANLAVPKAVILGNHDAWESFSRKRLTPRLLESLDALRSDHLAYGVRELPQAGLSIVGARPFSWGGQSLRSVEVYEQLYGVTTMQESARRIVDAAREAQHRDLLILAHNGPSGLSHRTQDIYGKDFGGHPGGDWGDEDLRLAIEEMQERGLRVRSVVAGHMHHRLTTPRDVPRTRFVRRDGTLFVNPAVVPRVRKRENGSRAGHFVRMQWSGGELQRLVEFWVDERGEVVDEEVPEVLEV